MSQLRIYRCEKCGKIIVVLKPSACGTMCCGQEMVELQANTTDAAQEKHVPAVTRDGNVISVNVGTVDHPMTEEHYIEFIVLETKTGFRVEYLKPGDAPKADFYEKEKAIAVYAYCNLHGLWKLEA
ncbi:MAG: desulfoferrodoxin Dfx [Solobacterium sp.]|nr:desulfoferrodoxin Dfx [Solobacterium sp.]